MRDYRAELTDVFRDLFDDDDIVLQDSTTAADIAGWDSLKNVRLLVQVEKRFGIHFSTGEVVNLKNVGELIGLIEARCKS